jgi:hypothetical protein
MSEKLSESAILKQILDYLAAKHILAFRMNIGQANMGDRFVRFGVRGMADILAFVHRGLDENGKWCSYIRPLWIECKTAKGAQSQFQRSFQLQVEVEGHKYIVARSIEDVEAVL